MGAKGFSHGFFDLHDWVYTETDVSQHMRWDANTNQSCGLISVESQQ